MIVCKHCHCRFVRKRGKMGPCPSYCSQQCRDDFNNGVVCDRDNQTCVACGHVFADKRKRRYCSQQCRDAGQAARVAVWRDTYTPPTPHTKTCPCCDTAFNTSDPDAVCCSRKCGQLNQHGIKLAGWVPGANKPRNDRRASQARRARKLGATVEKFHRDEIFKRDGYVCQRCGCKTRPGYKHIHPLAPNLDHIVPLSKGGDHTRANTQCLCRACNASKGNTIGNDQLRLVV